MKRLTILSISLMIAVLAVAQQKNIITVAQNGGGNFKTIQHAFDAVPVNNKQPVIIYVKNGDYREKLQLDSSKSFVTLVGEDRFKTIIINNDHTGKVAADGHKIGTMDSYACRINADHFTAKNITFENDAGFHAGQAVGLEVRGDEAAFIDCRIIGNQDILFTNNPNSREYYKNCYIEGTTDFIFGSATAFFDECRIHSKKNSHVTAASTPEDHAFGYVFYDCELTGDTTVTNASLGRPWRPYACVAYIHCYIGPHIRPEGWSNWNNTDKYKTARYAEYESYGPGANPAARVKWSRQLTDKEAKKYTIANVLGGWIPPGSE